MSFFSRFLVLFLFLGACCVGMAADGDPPRVLGADWLGSNQVRVTFDTPIALSGVDPSYFAINGERILPVDFVALTNDTEAVLTLAPGTERQPGSPYQLSVCCVRDLQGHVIEPTVVPIPGEFELVSFDAGWSYTASPQFDPEWNTVDYTENPSAWSTGPGLFGDGAAEPVASLIQTEVRAPLNGGALTGYYRSRFLVPDRAILAELLLNLYADDGVVVYLNGTEVLRLGVPAGQGPYTLATRAVGTATLEGPFALDQSLVRGGTNVLAVEVHQDSLYSPDHVWGGQLVGRINARWPSILITRQPTEFEAAAQGELASFCVEADGPPPLRYQWRRNGVNLPGETNDCFQLQVFPDRLGEYSVVVWNDEESVLSDSAGLLLREFEQEPADDFANFVFLSGPTQLATWSNLEATREPGEPYHFGKYGGHSMWYSWQASTSGIVTLNTHSSGFDTLLAVYTGDSLDNLTEVASDDDRGGFLTSELQFNAVQGETYRIVIDGLAGSRGNLGFGLGLEITTETVPVITGQPQSQTVEPGNSARFAVLAEGEGLTYQWARGDTLLPGATDESLQLSAVTVADVGHYTVWITNEAGRVVQSLPASLEIGPFPDVTAQDKLGDLFSTDLLTGTGGAGGAGGGFQNAGGFLSVGVGTVGRHIFSNAHTTNTVDHRHCGAIGGASKWFRFRLTNGNAGVVLFTVSSNTSADTVLAVYQKPVTFNGDLRVACDVASGGNGRSLAGFAALNGVEYWVAVDTVFGAPGNIELGWAIGPPKLTNEMTGVVAFRGGTVLLDAGVGNPSPDLGSTWQRAGAPPIHSESGSVVLRNVDLDDAAVYTVVVTNRVGAVTADLALLSVLELDFSGTGPQLTGLLGPRTRLRTRSLLQSGAAWAAVTSNLSFDLPAELIVTNLPPGQQRFFSAEPLGP